MQSHHVVYAQGDHMRFLDFSSRPGKDLWISYSMLLSPDAQISVDRY